MSIYSFHWAGTVWVFWFFLSVIVASSNLEIHVYLNISWYIWHFPLRFFSHFPSLVPPRNTASSPPGDWLTVTGRVRQVDPSRTERWPRKTGLTEKECLDTCFGTPVKREHVPLLSTEPPWDEGEEEDDELEEVLCSMASRESSERRRSGLLNEKKKKNECGKETGCCSQVETLDYKTAAPWTKPKNEVHLARMSWEPVRGPRMTPPLGEFFLTNAGEMEVVLWGIWGQIR